VHRQAQWQHVAIGCELRIRKLGFKNSCTKFLRKKLNENRKLMTSDEDRKILRKSYENMQEAFQISPQIDLAYCWSENTEKYSLDVAFVILTILVTLWSFYTEMLCIGLIDSVLSKRHQSLLLLTVQEIS